MDLRFLSPLFLIGLSAAAVPIVIHLVRRRAEPVVPFAAVRFLQRTPVEQARRRRLREWLLLALRTLALALLALSFARPYLAETRAAQAGPLTVIAVDTSFSVSAPAQVERARALARQAIDAAPAGRAMALVVFDERSSVVVPPTLDRGVVGAGLARVAPGARTTRYGAAISAAADLLAGRGGRLAVVSDLQAIGWAEPSATSLPPATELQALDVGPPPGNLAITSLRRAPTGLVAAVRNFGPTARTTRARVAIEGGRPVELPVTVQPRATANVVFPLVLPERGTARAEIVDEEGYPADNVRFAVLDAPPRPRLVAVARPGSAGSDSFYLERALAAAEGPEGMRLERVTPENLSADPAVLEHAAGVVLFTVAGLDRRAGDAITRAVEQGAGLLVVPGPSLDPTHASGGLPSVAGPHAADVQSSEDPLTFAPTDVRHPVFRAFGADGGLLGSARFRRIVRWPEGEGRQALARFSNGVPALLEVSAPRGHVLLLASDLANAWNDFALRPAFVPFVHDLLRYLAAGRPVASEYRVGEWTGPGGEAPGIVTVPAGGAVPTVRPVAVNVDIREADDSRLSPDAFVAAVPRAEVPERAAVRVLERDRERDQSLWRYGLMIMLLGLVAESVIGRRG